MAIENTNEAIDEREREGNDNKEEEQPFLEQTALERQVRLLLQEATRPQQEEMLLIQDKMKHQQWKMNQQDDEIRNLKDEIRNILSELESTSDAIRSSENPQDVLVVEQDVESRPSGRQRLRRTGGSPLSNILGRNRTSHKHLPEDIFTMMMMSRPCSASWALGIFVWMCQLILCVLVFGQIVFFDTEIALSLSTFIGQSISIVFVFFAQGDMFSSVRTCIWFRKKPRWDIILLGKDDNDDPPSCCDWIIHILFPNMLKFTQAFAVLIVTYFLILSSDNILDLIKDFTSLMIVSELDNMVFDFVVYGYLGESLYLKTVDAEDIEIDDVAQRQGGSFIFQKLWLWVLLCGSLGLWCFAVFNFYNQRDYYYAPTRGRDYYHDKERLYYLP